MSEAVLLPDLSDRRVLVPGGTRGVGEGVVRAHLSAGAHVVVPTFSTERARQFRDLLGDRFVDAPDPAQVTSAQLGAVTVTASASTQTGRHVRLLNRAQAEDALVSLGAAQ